MTSPSRTDLPSTPPDFGGEEGGEIIINPSALSGAREKNEVFADPDIEHKHLGNRQLKQDIRERRRYAIAAFRLTRMWVCFLIASTFLQFVFSIWGKGLTEGMFIALVTTTTASVLGVWALVGGYLFGFPRFNVKNMLDKKEE